MTNHKPVFRQVISLLTNDRTTAERKPYYDERDKAALRLMRKLRVDWSAGEDSFLLLCKVTIPNMFIIIRFVNFTASKDS